MPTKSRRVLLLSRKRRDTTLAGLSARSSKPVAAEGGFVGVASAVTRGAEGPPRDALRRVRDTLAGLGAKSSKPVTAEGGIGVASAVTGGAKRPPRDAVAGGWLRLTLLLS